jgi:hypothetical protein
MDEGLTVPLDMRVGWRKKSIAVYNYFCGETIKNHNA